jgi:PhzF family phenazine biosynthesis protein
MLRTWVPMFGVDAFTSRPFGGNPAAVCLISCSLDDELYRSIAAEMEHPETAFVEKIKDGEYKLRWFTPKVEIKLCGHATLATAHVIFEQLDVKLNKVSFKTLSGVLTASKVWNGIKLDFPRDDPKNVETSSEILAGLGLKGVVDAVYGPHNGYLILVVETEEIVRGIKPDFERLLSAKTELDIKAVCVTTRGSSDFDFVSRFFAPWLGINEDPVTGSAHTVLTPYWSGKLGKKEMRAYQASARGGELVLDMDDNRVYLTGPAVTVVKGNLLID